MSFFDAAKSSSSSSLANSASMLAGSVGESNGGRKFARPGGSFSGATLAADGCSRFGPGGGDCLILLAGDGVSVLGFWFTGRIASADLGTAVSFVQSNIV